MKLFWGTPSTKRACNHKFTTYNKKIKKCHATFLSTMLIFASMLIFRSSSFGSCLFSRHAYFRTNAYFRESTVLSDMICFTLNSPGFMIFSNSQTYLILFMQYDLPEIHRFSIFSRFLRIFSVLLNLNNCLIFRFFFQLFHPVIP